MVAEATANRLLNSSARKSYDPDIDIDWDRPIDTSMMFMPAERVSLYGTRLWATMSEEQRVTLSQHEYASTVGAGVWFEQLLMRMMVRYTYRRDPQDPAVQFALTEVGDETRHVVMFSRSIKNSGLPTYRRPKIVDVLAATYSVFGSGPCMFAPILVAEETLDRYQRVAMADESLSPVIRMVHKIHVIEEARHVRFAREEITREFPALSPVSKVYHQLVTAVVAAVVVSVFINRNVYAAAGLDVKEALRVARHNPRHHENKRWMGEKIMGFLTEQGMVPWYIRPIYRAVHLL